MFTARIQELDLIFQTESEVFSPTGVDRGTLAMLSTIDFKAEDIVLDLGCGYGVVGILAARKIGEDKVTMCDVSEQCVRLSKINCERNGVPHVNVIRSDGFSDVPGEFTLILSNPPYHTDFSVAKAFIEQSYRKLAKDGRIVMVTKRLTWYKNKLTAVFGGVHIDEIDGYYVFTAKKRERVQKKQPNQKMMSKKLQRKYGGKNSAEKSES